MRFSAAGRPASTCPAVGCAGKRNKILWRSILMVCALARQYNVDIHPHECSARQWTSEAFSLSRQNLIGTCTGATVFEQVLRPARLMLHPGDPRPSASPRPGYGAAWPDTISCHDPVQPTPPLGLCRFLTVVGGAGRPSRAAVKPYTTRQLGFPGENARWGSGFDSPWRGGGGSPFHGLPPSSSTLCHR